MQQQTYVEGQRVTVDGEFRLEGVRTDPTIVIGYVRAPSGALTELVHPHADLVRTDVGTYAVAFISQESGTYSVRLTGAGVVDAVGEAFVNVAPSRVI